MINQINIKTDSLIIKRIIVSGSQKVIIKKLQHIFIFHTVHYNINTGHVGQNCKRLFHTKMEIAENVFTHGTAKT